MLVSIFKKQIRHSLPKTLHKKNLQKITKNDLEMLVIYFAKYIKKSRTKKVQKPCKTNCTLSFFYYITSPSKIILFNQ